MFFLSFFCIKFVAAQLTTNLEGSQGSALTPPPDKPFQRVFGDTALQLPGSLKWLHVYGGISKLLFKALLSVKKNPASWKRLHVTSLFLNGLWGSYFLFDEAPASYQEAKVVFQNNKKVHFHVDGVSYISIKTVGFHCRVSDCFYISTKFRF